MSGPPDLCYPTCRSPKTPRRSISAEGAKLRNPITADSNIIKLKCLGIAKTSLHHGKVKFRLRNPKRNFQKSRKLKFWPISQLKPFFEPWGADICRFLRFGFRI